MQKTIKIASIIIFTISLLFVPIFGIAILFGLAGSTASYYVIIALGYIGLIISSFVCIFRYKFFPVIIFSIILIIAGFALDSKFWAKHNQDLCEELRANPTCIEDECGFDCTDDGNGHGIGIVTSGFICKDKDMSLCQNPTEIETIKGQQYTVEYVPKEDIYPAYGYGGGNSAVVRQDLPPRVKNFVKAHELYHCQDKSNFGGWLGREIRANVIPGLKDPIGLAATVWKTITDVDRIKFYLKRIKEGH